MTRKDYVAIAEAIRKTRTQHGDRYGFLAAVTENVADVLAADNPRFDRARFAAACAELSERDRLEARGYADGHAAGTWVEIENEEQARRILAMLDEGDPEVFDWLPSPRLGGEYADEPTWSDVLAEEDCEDSDDGRPELLDSYEYAFSCAAEREVVRACRALLGLVPADLGTR